MSSLPADATAVEIEEEILYQRTLIVSLDSEAYDYADRLQELQVELGLLEERLALANEPNVDTSDSAISFDSTSTSLTVPSSRHSLDAQSTSRTPSLSKRPVPADFEQNDAPQKRPSPSPAVATAPRSYEERMKRLQAEAENTWKCVQLQKDRDAAYARELSQRGGDVRTQPGPSSSRPALQSTLHNGTVLPPVRSLLGPGHLNPLPTHIKREPDQQPARTAPRTTHVSDDDVIDLTADGPSTFARYPTLPAPPPLSNTVDHLRTTSTPNYGYTLPPMQGNYALPPPNMQPAVPSSSMPWVNPFQQLQNLINTASNQVPKQWFPRPGNLNDNADDYDDDDDDDALVWLGSNQTRAMPGQSGYLSSSHPAISGVYRPHSTMPGSFDPYAGREDLYHSRYDEIEHYNPEKTREEINALLNNIRPDQELPDHLLVQTPEAMSIKLHKYQELGLTWLKKCEEGSNQGGILADDMGLGKTIQMLSLMVSHKSTDPKCKTTLIVAPVALLRQWKQEIEQKIKRRFALTVHIHHQTAKKQHFRDLAVYDIVLTTFGSLAMESKKMEKFMLRKKFDSNAVPNAAERCCLIGPECKWYRVILDEAQCIKNRQTQTAKAAHMLKATYRFCMTGTPMMNGVVELYSLIKFLHIKPYDQWEKFRLDITQPLKSGIEDFRDPAMQRLQALCKAVMLRRTKKSEYRGKPILILPERSTEVDHAVFDEDEQNLYTALEQKTQITFNKYLRANAVGRSYSAILVLLLRLRQACCHPFLIKDLSIAAAADMSVEDLLDLAGQLSEQAVNRIKETNGNFECPICMDAVINPAIFLPCGHDTCRECYVKLADTSNGIAQGHENGAKARCPHCRGDIDAKKITDFVSFKRVWMPELLTREEKEQYNILDEKPAEEAAEDDVSTETESEADDEDGDSTESESEDEGSDLDGFIVNDDEISDAEPASKKAGKRKAVEEVPAKKKKSKKHKSKSKSKKPAPVEKVEKRLTFANLKASAGASAKKKAKLLAKVRESYRDSAKIRQLLALLDEIMTNDPTEKVLVFSQWTSLLDLCEIAVEPKGWGFRRYDGSMNAKDRADAVDEFKDPRKNITVMFVSLKAGNAGLNLNVASQVIILDPFWNPYIEEQAIDRAHRIGQTRPVKVHRILVENTVEDRILTLQEEKRKVIETALDEQQASQLSRLGPRELAYLFGVSRNINDPISVPAEGSGQR